MDEKPRVTFHLGKGSKGSDKVYGPKHNPRTFDLSLTPHIDPNLTHLNMHYQCCEGQPGEDQERIFYEKTFARALEKRNLKQLENRHPDRLRDMDWYRTARNTGPASGIFQCGYYDKDTDSVVGHPKEVCVEVWDEFVKWHNVTFPQVVFINYDWHFDEPECQDHLQHREVFIAYDEDGDPYSCQEDCLRQMGIEIPGIRPGEDPLPDKASFLEGKEGDELKAAKKEWDKLKKDWDQHHNRKQVYTEICRAKLQELFIERGYDIETTPRAKSEQGLSHAQYKQKKDFERAVRLEKEELGNVQMERCIEEDLLRDVRESVSAANAENERLKAENARLRAQMEKDRENLARERETVLSLKNALFQLLNKVKEILREIAKDRAKVNASLINARQKASLDEVLVAAYERGSRAVKEAETTIKAMDDREEDEWER